MSDKNKRNKKRSILTQRQLSAFLKLYHQCFRSGRILSLHGIQIIMTGSQKSTLNQIWFGYQSLSFTTSKETSNLSQMNKELNKLKGYYDKTET